MKIKIIEESNNMLLSRNECNMIRGLAIILIVINNFGHLIHGVHPDNEFYYSYENINGFLHSLANSSDILPLDILSFYSPFGVMLFIFLSGYGLVLKYEGDNARPVSKIEFSVSHYKKLFIMQAKGLALFLLLYFIYDSNGTVSFLSFIKQLFLTGNLFSLYGIRPGPYWFFGMIFEIYIVYRFIFYNCSSRVMMIITLASIVFMGVLEPSGKAMIYARLNLFLALLPFSMGILAARHWNAEWTLLKTNTKCTIWLVLSFVLLTLCKFNFYSWLLMPIFIISTTIPLIKLLYKNSIITQCLVWLGRLSGVMFIIHPTLREILLLRANENCNCYPVLFLYFFLTIVLSILLKPAFSKERSQQAGECTKKHE